MGGSREREGLEGVGGGVARLEWEGAMAALAACPTDLMKEDRAEKLLGGEPGEEGVEAAPPAAKALLLLLLLLLEGPEAAAALGLHCPSKARHRGPKMAAGSGGAGLLLLLLLLPLPRKACSASWAS